MNYFCAHCGKEFELSVGQLKMYNNAHVTIFYCSKECKREISRQRSRRKYRKRVERNKDGVKEYALKYYDKNRIRISEKSFSKDLSPNQLGYKDLSPLEKQSMVSRLSGAQVKAYKTNRYSKRRGVHFITIHNKKTGTKYNYWYVEKRINNVIYRKRCDSEEEAITYVEELENKYFDQDQLNIRDKSLKSMNKKEDK